MKSVLQIARPFGPSFAIAASLTLAGCTGETQVAETEAGSGETTAAGTLQSDASAASGIRDIDVSEVGELLNREDGAVVLDVRTPEEFDAGHIDGAINADFLAGDFAAAIADLDRDTTYILHCKSGSRSTRALEILEGEGFTSVAHLTAGYDGWKAAQEAE